MELTESEKFTDIGEFKKTLLPKQIREFEKIKAEQKDVIKYTTQIDGGYIFTSQNIDNLKKIVDEIDKDTNELKIVLFAGKSTHKKAIFLYKFTEREQEKPQSTLQSLGGLDGFGSQSLSEVLNKNNEVQQLKWTLQLKDEKCQALEKELNEWRAIKKEQEKEIDKLDAKIADLEQANKSTQEMKVKELTFAGISLATALGYVKPDVSQNILNGLSGLATSDADEQSVAIGYLNFIKEKFGEVEEEYNELVELLSEKPNLVPLMLENLKNYLETLNNNDNNE